MMDKALAVALGLIGGHVTGLCVASLWLALKLPMRVQDVFDAGNPTLYALALLLGAMLGASQALFSLPLGIVAGCLALLAGGVFVGMLAGALTEVLDVLPTLFTRLRITSDMRWIAFGMLLGKTAGAFLACMLETP